MSEIINLAEKFDAISEYCSPKILAELNGQTVKAVRFKGEFVWHHHENEDELFLVIEGLLTIKFRDRECFLKKGEMLVVPRGVEHCPVAENDCLILLFEPSSTLNTGNVQSALTQEILEKI